MKRMEEAERLTKDKEKQAAKTSTEKSSSRSKKGTSHTWYI